MKKSLFLFGAILYLTPLAMAESCYKVNIKQKIDVEKCTAVPVVLTVSECDGAKKLIDETTLTAQPDCKSTPLRLKTPYKGSTLVSITEPAQVWGGVNFRVISTSASGPEAKVLTKEVVAKSRKPASVRIEAPKSKQHPPMDEKVVQSHSDAVIQEAKIKDAQSGAVAPAEPSGKIEVAPIEKMVKEEPKIEVPIPLNIKVSGFAWIESEDSKNFGYDSTSKIPNFDASAPGSQQSFVSFFSNLQLDIGKDRTNFTTVFEVGEMVSGEETTGGIAGGRKTVMEVRNAYLTHQIDAVWDFKAGLLPLSSDPNSYILADNLSAALVDYKKENLTVTLWTAKALDKKPGTLPGGAVAGYAKSDQYWGASVQPKFSEQSKLTAFSVLRKTEDNLVNAVGGTPVAGNSQSSWYGGTYDLAFNERYSMQATGILNQVKFSGPTNDMSDSYQAHLFDAKLLGTWKEQGLDVLIEGVMTSGASDSVDKTQNTAIVGKRKGFNSGVPAYLFTVATSDGVDDAPGSPKESVISSLSQPEGVQIALVKISKAFTEKFTGFIRAGQLQTSAASAATGSRYLGDEIDLNATYELSPGTTLQLDYGYFKPGAYFEKTNVAEMFTTRLKFSF